ncbi:hypothetical protein [Leekyejoonella antrihumi]|uniref:hypothetical protein n=1 Tax=Leekyejoonella antrihumi TaxID=1660198 RepID=UPI001FE4EE77|nr:hypothetical protein [Leekyejoonella antrihumi]
MLGQVTQQRELGCGEAQQLLGATCLVRVDIDSQIGDLLQAALPLPQETGATH